MAKLNTTIHINNERGAFIFGPDDDLPEWAVDKLVADGTPGIWAEEPKAKSKKAEPKKAEPKKAEPVDLGKLNKDKLVELATSKQIQLKGDETKDTLIELITNHESESNGGNPPQD